MNQPARLRVGLIGTGRIGQVHARNIAASADTELRWIADPFVEGAQLLARELGGEVTDDAERIFASDEVDAVVIASPTPTHLALIARAISRGIPVLCEKPIDLDIERVDALRAAVAESGVPVAIGFNRRFDPAFAEVRARVAAGEIGEVEHLTIVSRDQAPPPASYIGVSGGIFRDMTIHDLDMARFFLPDIVEVTAVGATTFSDDIGAAGDFDTAVTTLRASTGALVTIINSRHSAVGYDQRLEVAGELGVLAVDNARTGLVRSSTVGAVDARAPYEPFFLERYTAAYVAELAAFVQLARGEASASPGFEDGRAALLLADAAHRSASERRTIALPAR